MEVSDPRAWLLQLCSELGSVDSAVPRVVHFLRVAENASSLESLPRRSAPQTAICTFRQALLCSASRDRALVWQDTVYLVDIQLAQRKGLKIYQTRSNAIILYDTLTAYCISKAIVRNLKILHSRRYMCHVVIVFHLLGLIVVVLEC